MRRSIFFILLIISTVSYSQPADNSVSSFSEKIYKYNSENYIQELAKDMDTVFFNRFEPEILAFEEKDKLQGIEKGKILFIGSSSIRRWKTIKNDLAPLPVLNRGFGGSTMPEADYYFFRTVTPYKPSAIVLYEGDNDVLAPFLTPEVILRSFIIFTELSKQYLPRTKIFFVSIKPSPSRSKYQQKMNQVNQLIEEYCRDDKDLYYIDITKGMYDHKGNIRTDIFRKDLLHLNSKGYELWAKIIKEALMRNL